MAGTVDNPQTHSEFHAWLFRDETKQGDVTVLKFPDGPPMPMFEQTLTYKSQDQQLKRLVQVIGMNELEKLVQVKVVRL